MPGVKLSEGLERKIAESVLDKGVFIPNRAIFLVENINKARTMFPNKKYMEIEYVVVDGVHHIRYKETGEIIV